MVTSSLTPEKFLGILLPKLLPNEGLYQRLRTQLLTGKWTKVYVGLSRVSEIIEHVNALEVYKARVQGVLEEAQEDFPHLGPIMVRKVGP